MIYVAIRCMAQPQLDHQVENQEKRAETSYADTMGIQKI